MFIIMDITIYYIIHFIEFYFRNIIIKNNDFLVFSAFMFFIFYIISFYMYDLIFYSFLCGDKYIKLRVKSLN